MTQFVPRLVHTPVIPFKDDRAVDYETFGRLIEFHLREGAEALAVPMHAAESVSLADDEQRKLLQYTLGRLAGRAPVIAHVSDSGTGIAVARARYAADIGAAAIVATTPYYWTPPPAMVLEHFAQIGSATRLPFYVWYTPDDMPGTKIGVDLLLKLISRLDNFAGVVDSSLDWQFMVNVASNAQRVRPYFQMLSGTEYMVSAGPLGATSMFTSLAGVAPRLVRRLYERCHKEQYFEARPDQEALSELRQIVKKAGFSGLKAAMRIMGRDCGVPRPPNARPDEAALSKLATDLQHFGSLQTEPRGW